MSLGAIRGWYVHAPQWIPLNPEQWLEHDFLPYHPLSSTRWTTTTAPTTTTNHLHISERLSYASSSLFFVFASSSSSSSSSGSSSRKRRRHLIIVGWLKLVAWLVKAQHHRLIQISVFTMLMNTTTRERTYPNNIITSDNKQLNGREIYFLLIVRQTDRHPFSNKTIINKWFAREGRWTERCWSSEQRCHC